MPYEKYYANDLLPKTALPEQHGHVAFFIDSEGNRIGLYSSS